MELPAFSGSRAVMGAAFLLAVATYMASGVDQLSAQEKPPATAAGQSQNRDAVKEDARDDASPWGVASGAEWFGAYPKFNPLLSEAGVNWLRGFPMWRGIQPRQGEWNWARADALVANARANNIHLTVPLGLLASWASADGDPRKFPIKDMQYWRDYVEGLVNRYHNEIKYWEVWNEFDGGFAINGTPQIYADLVRDAYDTAKKIDPDAKIGMSVANFDVGFLDRAIKVGAADHFDYVAVHPYEILGGVADHGEGYFLSMAGSLRRMLAANGQKADMPLWITEIGAKASIAPDPEGDQVQAETLVKAYVLSMAAGFQRIFWFEARGPAYGKGKNKDLGLIRANWTLRPSYDALKTLTGVLGREPRYLGWINLGNGGLGFLFEGHGGAVLAAWSPAEEEHKVTFPGDVHVSNLGGKDSVLAAGTELRLTKTPLLITKIPAALVKQATINAGKPLPSEGDYAHAESVSCRLQATNIDEGLRQIHPQTTVAVDVDGVPARRMDFARPNGTGHYALFRVDPQFALSGTNDLEITAVVRRITPDQNAGLNLEYESFKGYIGAQPWHTVPADDQWHELTWKVTAPNFVGAWGYNFRLDAISSPNELYVKEVRVKKLGASQ